MARAAQVGLFFREVRERLSESAVDILIGSAQVLSEGQHAEGRDFFGTVMLTVDLARVRDKVREPCDSATAQRVAALMATDPRVRRRVQQVARGEAQRLAGGKLAAVDVDVTARASGTKVYVDADFQARGRPA
jgi:hypothetical protein